MKKTTHNMTLEMVLEYPKVFDQEGKPGDIDRGDPKSTQKWLRDLSKNPKAKVNAYFTSEEQITFLEEFDGFERMTQNPKTGEPVDRIKDGNPELGIGKYIQLTRTLNDVREFIDKNGNEKTMDKGGLPTVKVLNEDGSAFVTYDYDELGPISNGSEAKVRFEPKYMRLEAIGITNLVEYVPNEEQDDF